MENVIIEQTKTERITDFLNSMNVDEKRHMDIVDRRNAMSIATHMKRIAGKEFVTTVKGQPVGKFAVWRTK